MMERKRGKRAKPVEDGLWDCSVCTYKNSAEAFKCAMCDVRKGTSTRKPKPNPQLVAQQVAQQLAPPPPKREKQHSVKKPDKVDLGSDTSQDSHRSETRDRDVSDTKQIQPRHTKSFDNGSTSSSMSMEVTVGDLTVIITDYKPKVKRKRPSTESQNSRESSVHTTDTGSPEMTTTTTTTTASRVPD